jgi:hypothetical protein
VVRGVLLWRHKGGYECFKWYRNCHICRCGKALPADRQMELLSGMQPSMVLELVMLI